MGGGEQAVRNSRPGQRRCARRSRKERSANRLWRWLRAVRGLQGKQEQGACRTRDGEGSTAAIRHEERTQGLVPWGLLELTARGKELVEE